MYLATFGKSFKLHIVFVRFAAIAGTARRPLPAGTAFPLRPCLTRGRRRPQILAKKTKITVPGQS
jgi:hypothetical protein